MRRRAKGLFRRTFQPTRIAAALNPRSASFVLGRHYRSGRAVRLELAGEKIGQVSDVADDARAAALPWVAPGFVDIQWNGYGGQEFSSSGLTAEQVTAIAARQADFGVTQFCPTVTTASRETIEHAMRTIADACRQARATAHTLPGIHLEGPY